MKFGKCHIFDLYKQTVNYGAYGIDVNERKAIEKKWNRIKKWKAKVMSIFDNHHDLHSKTDVQNQIIASKPKVVNFFVVFFILDCF